MRTASPSAWFRLLGRNARDLALLLKIGPRLKDDNRRLLETIVFPALRSDPAIHRLLFVGCHWYTWHYKDVFRDEEFWTIDVAPQQARYGSSRHIIDSVEHVERHFACLSLDVVMLIGVIGWGLDDPAVIEGSLAACHAVLREGGLLMLGCDEVPDHTPTDLARSPTLHRMQPFAFPGLGAARYRCGGELQHTCLFFTK